MNRIVSMRFVLRFSAAFVILSMGFYFLPKSWVQRVIPLITVPTHWMFPTYEFETGMDEDAKIFIDVEARHKLADQANKTAMIQYRTQIDAGFIYSIPLIFFPLLFAWPGIPPQYRLKAALAILPVIFVLVMFDTSLTLIYQMERRFHEETLDYQLRHFISKMMNRGGRQFFGLLLFGAVMAPFYLTKPALDAGLPPGRNAPCPCGSGKKYKKCCMP